MTLTSGMLPRSASAAPGLAPPAISFQASAAISTMATSAPMIHQRRFTGPGDGVILVTIAGVSAARSKGRSRPIQVTGSSCVSGVLMMCPGFVATEISLDFPTLTVRRSDSDPAADREFKTLCAETHAGRARGTAALDRPKTATRASDGAAGVGSGRSGDPPDLGPGTGGSLLLARCKGGQHSRALRFAESRPCAAVRCAPQAARLTARARKRRIRTARRGAAESAAGRDSLPGRDLRGGTML